MSTFLEGVNRLKDECGVPGADLTTTVGQTNELKRLVNWYEEAWNEIQIKKDNWKFRYKPISFQTVAEQQRYDVVTDIGLTDYGSWSPKTFRIFLTSAGQGGETFLTDFTYSVFRDTYLYGSLLTSYSRPTGITEAPDDALLLALPPDDIYTISGEYYSTPQVLSESDDPDNAVPDMPVRFHLAIVGKAMEYYALFESAPEVLARSERLWKLYYNKLNSDQGQPILKGPSFI